MDSATTNELEKKIVEYGRWYHDFDFLKSYDISAQQQTHKVLAALDALGLPQDLGGARVLDIGCCDGFFSFEMQRRGATVVSVDYRDVNELGFGIACEFYGYKNKAQVDAVYNITPDKYGQFDIVLFLGILYHLRNPLLALDRVRALLETGGSIFIETHANHTNESSPTSSYYPRDAHLGNYTNFFGPNSACIEAWLTDAEFGNYSASEPLKNRICATATAVEDATIARVRDLEWGVGKRIFQVTQ